MATTLIGAFLLGLKLTFSSVSFLTPFLLILALCLVGLRDIANRLNETCGPRKALRQGKGFKIRVSWQWVALIAPYGCLAWIVAGTAVGEFLIFLMFSSSIGLIFLLLALIILSLCLIANLTNRNQAELNLQSGEVMNSENRMEP